MVFCEAFAHGTPIAASHLGPLPALIEPVDAGNLRYWLPIP